ncbi:hypothetical protein [Itacaiunas virus]|uniref:Uncharacterized protein n=1 Tax=Itacaiunas virus TaxID=490111 RepID=A0A0D3R0Z4_9RHAB|nr:hypothetical protein [Itacaiunas virus]AJR28288.1 hypothetical protein [Itacaiunas virus]
MENKAFGLDDLGAFFKNFITGISNQFNWFFKTVFSLVIIFLLIKILVKFMSGLSNCIAAGFKIRRQVRHWRNGNEGSRENP